MAAVAERSHADMLSDTPPLPTRLPDKAASIDLACTTIDSADAHAQPASRHLRNMALGRYGGINEDFVLVDGRRKGKAESV